jgi:hypothetical protein
MLSHFCQLKGGPLLIEPLPKHSYSHKMDQIPAELPLEYEFVTDPVHGSKMNRAGRVSFKLLA